MIELMVSMVIGLIVVGAVLALVLAMTRANQQTIQSTRLTQELRATASLITSDLRRAGSAGNPMDVPTANTLGAVDTATAGCIRYSYSQEDGTVVQRAISVANGAVLMGTNACGNGQSISSNNVVIGQPTFSRVGRQINVVLTGTLASDSAISRRYSESVFAPSIPVTAP